MAALLIGYARCSTDQQDLTAQRDGLAALGVAANRVYGAIADELTVRQVRLNLGGSVYDPTDPVGHEGGQSQRAFAWQAAKAQSTARSAPGGPAPGRAVQHR